MYKQYIITFAQDFIPTLQDFIEAAKDSTQISIHNHITEQLDKLRQSLVEEVNNNNKEIISAICKGMGSLSQEQINLQYILEAQDNALKSACTGLGNPVSHRVVRILLALKIFEICKVRSLVSSQTLLKLVEAYNKNLIPLIPEQGSNGGTEGDRTQLAHLLYSFSGQGYLYNEESKQYEQSSNIMSKKGFIPLKIKEYELQSLISGSQFTNALAIELINRARNLEIHSDLILCLSIEALGGVHKAFLPQIHQVRNHEGQITIASRVRSLIQQQNGSCSDLNQKQQEEWIHVKGKPKVQDAYSLRCAPQIQGATLDTLTFTEDLITKQIYLISSNPMVIENQGKLRIVYTGNFHNDYISQSCDYICIAIQELANLSERRIERLNNQSLNKILPQYLISNKPGVNSGMMVAHATAAMITSENKVLCHPASVDSIPTGSQQEDFACMSGWAGRKALQVLDNVEKVLALELLCATQAIDIIKNKNDQVKTTELLENVLSIIRQFIPFINQDEVLSNKIEIVKNLISSQSLLKDIKF